MTSMNNTAEIPIDKNTDLLLKNIAEEEGFVTYTLKVDRGPSNGRGFVSVMSKVCISGEDKEKNRKDLNLIVKNVCDGVRNVNLPISENYQREIYIYDKVFPVFKSLELAKGLSPSSIGPTFYKGSATLESESLILENLKDVGYVLHDVKTPMNEEHVALVMAKYAQLHALSLIAKEKSREEFDKLVNPLSDILIKFLKENIPDTVSNCNRKAMESLDKESHEDVIRIYKEFLNQVPSYLDELRQDVDDYSVVLHADCWCHNMMFKYADSDLSKPSDVRFIDFQVSKLGSPAMDLCYFFYTSSCKEALNRLDYYIEFYHKTLSSHILKLGGDPEKLLPFEVLKQHWKKYAKFGLIMATVAIHATLSEALEKLDVAELAEEKGSVSEVFSNDIANVTEYNDRIRHIILHFYKNKLF